jgi:uncharacterized protein (TIGR04255 family)
MGNINLKNKPLVEAIFELKWKLHEMPGGYRFDKFYEISIGRLFEKLRSKYPFQEQLETVNMPDEIAGYVVQYRFRKAENDWPVVQIGPGIITLNETDKYVWKEFKENAKKLVDNLIQIRTEYEKPVFNGFLLRYIDAIDYNYDEENVYDFLKDKMKLRIELYPNLFEGTKVQSLPATFDHKFSYPSEKPKGIVSLRFFRGKRFNKDSLLWETMVSVNDEETLNAKGNIIKCLEEAHDLTHNWFFKIISGELEKRFS